MPDESEDGDECLPPLPAFVKVNDKHQKSQTREQNKQVVDHCSGVKSLG